MDADKRIDVISFMAPVNDNTISRLIDVTYTALSEGSSEIHLYISSTGGKLHPAFTAYDFLRSLRAPLCTHNIGLVESSALVLFFASDKRCASPNSKFLFYNFEWTFYRDHIRFPEIIEAYESLKFDAERYTRIFKECTNGSFDIECCLYGPAKVMGPEAAIEAGIVTIPETEAPAIPELAKLWTIHA